MQPIKDITDFMNFEKKVKVKAKVINVNGPFADVIINGNKYLINNDLKVIR